jgi:superfamily II DNA/RNA helicase
VHRIGRTARAGSTGVAYSFFTKKNFMIAPELIEVMIESGIGKEFISEPLKHLALMALKAQSTNEQQVKRRWRKITGEAPEKAEKEERPVISLKELIKLRQEQKQETQEKDEEKKEPVCETKLEP